jgi:hypothetical protein
MGKNMKGTELEFRLSDVGFLGTNTIKKGLVAQISSTHANVGGPARRCFWSMIPIELGVQANTAGSAVALSASTTAAQRFYGDDGGVACTAEAAMRTLVSRFLSTISQSLEVSMFGAQSQLKIAVPAATDITHATGNRAGAWNYLEASVPTSRTLTLQGANKCTAASFNMVEVSGAGTCVVDTSHFLCAVGALTNVSVTTFTETGKFAAFACFNNASASYRNFSYGLYLSGCTRGISFDGVVPPADAGNYGQTLDCTWLAIDPGSGGSFGAKLMFSNTDTSGYVLYGVGIRCRSAAASAKVVGLNVSASAAVASSGQVIGGQFYLQNSGSYTIVGGGGYPSAALYCKSWLAAACDKASALWIDDESTTKATTAYMVDITMNGTVEIDNVFHIYGGDPGADTFIDFDTCDQGAGAFVKAIASGGETRSHRIKCTVNGSTVGYMSLYTD